MHRLPGGPATDLPACPRPGHEARRVVRDGRYGTPPRQRFRCVGPDGFHRFVPEVPRREALEGMCGHVAVARVAHALEGLAPWHLGHEPVEPVRPDAPEPPARRGPVPAVPDHAMRAVARPRTTGQVGAPATREPGHRALPRVAATLRDCPTRLPAAQDTYHAAIA